FSFDSGSRIAQFVEYLNEDQFTSEARRLGQTAAEQVLALRKRFASLHLASRHLYRQSDESPANPWTLFHSAISLGCVGDILTAKTCFKRIEDLKLEFDWGRNLQKTAEEYLTVLGDQKEFLRRIRETILKTRSLLRLPQKSEVGL